MKFFLPYLLFLSSVNAAVFSHEFVENDLISECRFTLRGQVYDLCPLVRSKDGAGALLEYEWKRAERKYRVSLGGMSRDRECPEGTWVCLTGTRSVNPQRDGYLRQIYHRPIAGKKRPGSSLVDQGINAVASISNLDDSNHDAFASALNLFLIGGFYAEKAQYVSIDFVCDPAAGAGSPIFLDERHDVHGFTWVTKYGCPALEASSIDTQTDENMELPLEPGSDSGNKDEEELVDTDHRPRMSRRWTAIVLFITGTIFISVFVLLTSLHARRVLWGHLRSLSTASSLAMMRLRTFFYVPQTFQFRAGESSLVRWAQEDMALGVINGVRDEEEGVMINDSWNGQGLDEYIPLKSGSLRHTKDYGSASSANTFW